jgi:hypothetical protein
VLKKLVVPVPPEESSTTGTLLYPPKIVAVAVNLNFWKLV